MRVQKGKRITAHDAQQLARFRAELQLVERLVGEGLSRQAATRAVFMPGAPPQAGGAQRLGKITSSVSVPTHGEGGSDGK